MTYSIEDIENAWADYKIKKVVKYLRDGKEMFVHLDGKRIETAGMLNAQTVDLQSVISFPGYLRTKWQR